MADKALKTKQFSLLAMKYKVLFVLATLLEIAAAVIFQDIVLLVALLACNALLFYLLIVHLEKTNISQSSTRRADLSVKIAHETLPYLRRGLNEANAGAIAKIIKEMAQVGAVSITDCERQLAYIGAGCDRHHPGDKILTEATKEVIRTGNYKLVKTQKELNCPLADDCDCPLAAAVIVPLMCMGKVVGTFKIYETKDGSISPDLIRLALGMGQILSLQVELAELNHQAGLVTEARLDALQAQINPHFFFNVINTIIATSRINPNRARRLLVYLADLFRKALKFKGSLISLKEEMELVNIYLLLEKARFGRKLKVKYDIAEEFFSAEIPRLSIQPIVENAVKHGITPLTGNGLITITARDTESEEGIAELVVRVQDNGVGIAKDRLKDVLLPGVGSGNGVGLANVHDRLRGLYGEGYGLLVESEPGQGTVVSMKLPYTRFAE